MQGEIGNLADLVRRAAAQRPDRTALIFRDRETTWSELDARVDAVAAGLVDLGLSAGDRVAVVLPNTPDFAVTFFGVLRAGLVALPINPGYTGRELTHALGDSGAVVLIGAGAATAAIAADRVDLPALRHIFIPGSDPVPGARPLAELAGTSAAGTGTADGTSAAEDGATGGPAGADRLAVLLYTSGTGGQPKGAMLTHRAMLANLEQADRIEPKVIGPNDVVLLTLPLFHAYGLGPGLCAIAYHAAAGVLVERFDPADTLEQVQRHFVSCVLGVPAMYMAWSLLPDVGEAFSSVRVAVCGAAPLDPAAQHRLLNATRHHVFEGYGLTETAPVVTSTLVSPVPKPNSIGRPIPGVEVKLIGGDGQEIEVDEEDDGASPGTDPGEIWVRGPNLFSGYWPDGAGGPDPDGWWATGDVAYFDDDGDMFLVDRLGELILVSGFNVYPREVEDVLSGHPAVAEAAVIGVPHPYTGQTVKAFVVLTADADPSAEELIGYCERNLARFKCPTAIEFVGQLPHSATGKVRKVLLRPAEVALEG